MTNKLFLAFAFCLTVTGCTNSLSAQQTQQMPSIVLPTDLDRVLRDYEREWQARSPSGLAALFAEDGFVLQPGNRPARGRKAIAQSYIGRGGALSLRPLWYAASDSIAHMVGAYSIAIDEPDIGKFILLLKRLPSGHWVITADMDNGNGD